MLTMAACCVLAGCRTSQPSVARDALIGSYVYRSEDPEGRATDHDLDHLVLRPDGKYDLIQGGSTKPSRETVGVWTIRQGANDGPTVLLDHAGYPVRASGNEIKLLIDDDVGIWYVKAK